MLLQFHFHDIYDSMILNFLLTLGSWPSCLARNTLSSGALVSFVSTRTYRLEQAKSAVHTCSVSQCAFNYFI